MDFFRNLAATASDEYTTIAADGVSSAEYTGLINTGCYMLNAVLSGSLFGGMANNKALGFAGETSTGKSFMALGIVKQFLDANPDSGVIYYDTEAAVTKDMMESRGIDPNRVIISEPQTIQQFRHHVLNMIENYNKFPKDKRPPMLMVLDSLGMLSSTKEIEDTMSGAETKDMTKAQVIKATFRVIRLKLAKAGIPIIVNNHVYAAIGANVPTNIISGGSGFLYAADTIAMLTKAKDRDDNGVIGNFITVNMFKSRLSKENSKVRLKLSYQTGLDKYYGLLELAEKYNVFKKVSTRYEMPDGSKVFGKTINDNPEKYYTEEILQKLELCANKEFKYGVVEDTEEDVVTVETTNEAQE